LDECSSLLQNAADDAAAEDIVPGVTVMAGRQQAS
jgi:hypothetical protein